MLLLVLSRAISTYNTDDNLVAVVIPVYDWFLSLDQEVELIWNWHSGLTGASLVYALSRYAMIVQSLVTLATNVPMTDLVRNFPLTLCSDSSLCVEVAGNHFDY